MILLCALSRNMWQPPIHRLAIFAISCATSRASHDMFATLIFTALAFMHWFTPKGTWLISISEWPVARWPRATGDRRPKITTKKLNQRAASSKRYVVVCGMCYANIIRRWIDDDSARSWVWTILNIVSAQNTHTHTSAQQHGYSTPWQIHAHTHTFGAN